MNYGKKGKNRLQFSWAGTLIDHGSRAPAGTFVKVYAREGVTITVAQAREPMGMNKRDHIKAVVAMPAREARRPGRPPTPGRRSCDARRIRWWSINVSHVGRDTSPPRAAIDLSIWPPCEPSCAIPRSWGKASDCERQFPRGNVEPSWSAMGIGVGPRAAGRRAASTFTIWYRSSSGARTTS